MDAVMGVGKSLYRHGNYDEAYIHLKASLGIIHIATEEKQVLLHKYCKQSYKK